MQESFIKKGPFIRGKNRTTKMMFHLLLALLPIIFFTFYKNGIYPFMQKKTDMLGLFYPLIFLFISTSTSFISEVLYAKFVLKKENVREYIYHSFSFFPGLFLGLILPLHTPIGVVILGAIFATIIGKMIYGGFGHNIFNPALVGRLFIITCYAATFSSNVYLNPYEVDTITSATPLTNVSLQEVGSYETLVAPYGNLVDFFIGTIPGAVGETSSFLCLLAFFYLSFKKVIKWKIPFFYVLTVFIITTIIGNIQGFGIWYPLFQILSGGLMFGAVFMATDPVTSPTTPIGQILYGLFLGILTVIFRFLTPFPEGVLTSILTMNLFVFILDKVGAQARFNFGRSLVFFVIAWGLMIEMGIYIGTSFEKVPESDSKYQILSKEKVGQKTIYEASYQGNYGPVRAKITFDTKGILSIELLEPNDQYGKKIKEERYLDRLKNANGDFSSVDTVSGATFTSNALKSLVENTWKDFKKEDIPVSDFHLLDQRDDGDVHIYTISKKGFYQEPFALEVHVFENQIIDIIVLKAKDSYWYKLEEEKYFEKFIGTDNFQNIDTVSGATISSKALKEALEKVIQLDKESDFYEE